jgi:molybdopterin biosynthesis enzyme MoaB
MEAIRRRGSASTPLASLSRGHAGIAREKTFVVNLPGSTGGVKDGLAVLDEVLEHVIDQLHGGDHDR